MHALTYRTAEEKKKIKQLRSKYVVTDKKIIESIKRQILLGSEEQGRRPEVIALSSSKALLDIASLCFGDVSASNFKSSLDVKPEIEPSNRRLNNKKSVTRLLTLTDNVPYTTTSITTSQVSRAYESQLDHQKSYGNFQLVRPTEALQETHRHVYDGGLHSYSLYTIKFWNLKAPYQ